MGPANRAADADQVLSTALEIAHDVAVNTAPLSVAISKRLLWASPPLDADEADRLETAMHHHVMGRADAREGVLAFLERREPRWSLSPTGDWPPGWGAAPRAASAGQAEKPQRVLAEELRPDVVAQRDGGELLEQRLVREPHREVAGEADLGRAAGVRLVDDGPRVVARRERARRVVQAGPLQHQLHRQLRPRLGTVAHHHDQLGGLVADP